jgi:anthranilate synthase component II
MILLIDNYDSFVHNLARYFARLGQETLVVRNDRLSVDDVEKLRPHAIVISPGPCTPAQAGCSVEVIRALHERTPMLGICLGHQAIGAAFGGVIARAEKPWHGRTSTIQHAGVGLFAALPSPMTVCRYHSLVIDEASLPPTLRVTARTADGAIMAVEHATAPLFGVQFHPEAALTEHGFAMLANFLRLAGCPVEVDVAALGASENRSPVAPSYSPPAKPLTF